MEGGWRGDGRGCFVIVSTIYIHYHVLAAGSLSIITSKTIIQILPVKHAYNRLQYIALGDNKMRETKWTNNARARPLVCECVSCVCVGTVYIAINSITAKAILLNSVCARKCPSHCYCYDSIQSFALKWQYESYRQQKAHLKQHSISNIISFIMSCTTICAKGF